MPTLQKSAPAPVNFLHDPKLKKKYANRLAKRTAVRKKLHKELADCERLTESDFLIRINARG